MSLPDGSVKVNDTTSTGRIFDGRLSYDKGAYLLRMLRWTFGRQPLFKGISGYLNDPKLRYGFATTADLQRNLEAVSGQSLGYFSSNGMPARATRLYGTMVANRKTESCCNA